MLRNKAMKSYWTARLLPLILSVGCASAAKPITHPMVPGSQTTDILSEATVIDGSGQVYPVNGRSHETYLMPKPFVDRLKQIVAERGNVSPQNKVLEAVCQGKEPKYFPKETIKLYVPKPPPGIPLDRALHLRKKFIEYAKAFISKQFFTSARHNNIQNDRGELSRKIKDSNTYASFYSIPVENESQLIDFYNQNATAGYYPSIAILNVPSEGNQVYIVPDLFQKNVVTFDTRNQYGWHTSKDEILSETRQTVSSEISQGFGSVGNDEPSVASMFVVGNPCTLGTGDNVHPLNLFYYADWNFIENNFTMLIPPEIQTQFFKDEHGLTVCGSSNYCGYTSAKKFSAEKAIKDRTQLWNRYYKTFTEIQESPNGDGSMIQFDVSLRMEIFCKYARSLDDLVSH